MTLRNKNQKINLSKNSSDDGFDENALDLFEQYGVTIDDIENENSENNSNEVKNDIKKDIVETTEKPVIEKSEEESVLDSEPKQTEYVAIAANQNVNTVFKQGDNMVGSNFVQQGVETVYEASASTSGIKTDKEKRIKESYTQKKEDKLDREIYISPKKKTIMIVEDDVDTLEMYKEVFETADYNVLCAQDGLEAMNLMSEYTPHIIFTGIVMPRMDGFAMMRALNKDEKTAKIPVVVNSHLGRNADKKEALNLGARDFMVRGFVQPREVVERVGAILLRGEYMFEFNSESKGALKFAKDMGIPDFFQCDDNDTQMVMKLKIIDDEKMIFATQFVCIKKDN